MCGNGRERRLVDSSVRRGAIPLALICVNAERPDGALRPTPDGSTSATPVAPGSPPSLHYRRNASVRLGGLQGCRDSCRVTASAGRAAPWWLASGFAWTPVGLFDFEVVRRVPLLRR